MEDQMTMQRMLHRCDYSKTGRNNIQEISAFHVEYDQKCHVCGEPLAPIREVLAYIYDELTRGSE
jgi:hypothetical protein